MNVPMDRREDDPDAGKPASGNPAAPGQLPDQAPDRAPGQLPAPNAAGLAFARAANTAAQATARSASTGEVPVTTSGSASDLARLGRARCHRPGSCDRFATTGA